MIDLFLQEVKPHFVPFSNQMHRAPFPASGTVTVHKTVSTNRRALHQSAMEAKAGPV